MPRFTVILLLIILALGRASFATQTTAPSTKLPNSSLIEKDNETNEDEDNGDDDEAEDDEGDSTSPSSIQDSHLASQNDDGTDRNDDDNNDDDDDDNDQIITGNVTLATDYILRGLSQTDHKPAIQGGFDFNHDLTGPLGVYANVFGSNVHFEDSNASMEFDTSAGISYRLGTDTQLSIGALYYTYFGDSSRNSWEIPFKLEWKSITAEIDYSPTWAGDGHAWYFNLGWSDEIVYKFRLGFSVGYSAFSSAQKRLRTEDPAPAEEAEVDNDEEEEEELRTAALQSTSAENSVVESPNYFDFKLSIAREFLDLDWELAGIWINHAEEINGTPGSTRAVLSVSKSF
jgi:uncharacterized protein (TIGR02001 family)